MLELQRQAKMTLGLIIFACVLLEKKVAYLRLYNILENYFRPIEKMTLSDRAQYRVTTRATNVGGKGQGERQTIRAVTQIGIRDRARTDSQEGLLGKPGRDLIERLRKDSASLSVSVGSSAGGPNHIAYALIAKAAGGDVRKLRTVVFQGGGEAVTETWSYLWQP